MENLGKDLRLQFHERLSSPLIGSFVISWLIWNYRLLAVLFSSKTVEERFAFMDTVLYPTSGVTWWYKLFGPLLCALAYIFIYPYPAKWVNGFWLRRERERKQQRDEIDGATRLTKDEMAQERKRTYARVRETEEENRQLREELMATKASLVTTPAPARSFLDVEKETENAPSEILRLKQSYEDAQKRIAETHARLDHATKLKVESEAETKKMDKERRELQKQNAEYQSKVAELEKEIATKTSKPPTEANFLSEGAKRIFKRLTDLGGSTHRGQLYSDFEGSMKVVRIDFYIDEMKRSGWVETAGGAGPNGDVALTEKGRDLALKEDFA